MIGDELARRGWRGHFFVPTAYLGRARVPRPAEPALPAELRPPDWQSLAHSPGIFRDLTPRQLLAEWQQSCDLLEQIIGERISGAAVPGGEVSKRVYRSAAAYRLRYLFTSTELRPRRYGDCWVLGRLTVKAGASPRQVAAWADGQGWRSALVVRQLKVASSRPLARCTVGTCRPVASGGTGARRRRLTRLASASGSVDMNVAIDRAVVGGRRRRGMGRRV